MKKTCDKCRAKEFTGLLFKCKLNYKTLETEWRGIRGLIPLDECPRPLTHKKYLLQKR